MQFSTSSVQIDCPYCGETFELVIDPGEAEQAYVEDCFVCCRPIHLNVVVDDDGDVDVRAHSENDC